MKTSLLAATPAALLAAALAVSTRHQARVFGRVWMYIQTPAACMYVTYKHTTQTTQTTQTAPGAPAGAPPAARHQLAHTRPGARFWVSFLPILCGHAKHINKGLRYIFTEILSMYYVAEGFSSMCVEYGVFATYFLAKTPG